MHLTRSIAALAALATLASCTAELEMTPNNEDTSSTSGSDMPSALDDQGTTPRDMAMMQGDDMPDDPNPAPDMRPDDPPPIDASCDGIQATMCDDFESDALDARYREVNFGPSAFSVDTSRAHSGTRSVKVQSMGFTQMLAVPVPAKTFYGRVYLTSDTPMNPGHNTYIAAGEGDGDPNHGEWIRIGEHREQLEINRKSDDKELLSSGDYNSLEGATQMAADTWYCLEFLYDGPGQTVRIWVDGAPVEKLHATDWTADYETFKFGYERYHGPDKTLWYDDLALGTERIGCIE